MFANSEDPDQTPRYATSDLGLHCLPATRLGVSSPQWINLKIHIKGGLKNDTSSNFSIDNVYLYTFNNHSIQITNYSNNTDISKSNRTEITSFIISRKIRKTTFKQKIYFCHFFFFC